MQEYDEENMFECEQCSSINVLEIAQPLYDDFREINPLFCSMECMLDYVSELDDE